jgi:archaellin
MYEWLIEQKEKYLKWLEEGGSCPVSDYIKKIFEDYYSNNLSILDEHLISEIPEEFKKDLIEEIKKILRSRGLETNNIKQILNKLIKHKKDYLKEIKLSTNELFGGEKNKTITKRNRRSIEGLKGKRKENYNLCVIQDTSSSMNGYFEKTLSYIFQNNIQLEFLQVDTNVKKHTTIKNKKQLQKIEIIGFGGTKLQRGIDYITTNKKLKKLNLLILTDGYTETLNFKNYNGKVLILSTSQKCSCIFSKKIKQIIIRN